MKSFTYRFRTLSALAEEVTSLKMGADGRVLGASLYGGLRECFGAGAKRHYPFGILFVPPMDFPPTPFQEMPEEGDWDQEPDLIFRPC
jgi:hypothetical protein